MPPGSQWALFRPAVCAKKPASRSISSARKKKLDLRFLAAISCSSRGEGPALIFDIGGGSTELVLIEPGGEEPEILSWYSAPWGVVSLAEKEFNDLTTLEDRLATYERMRSRVAASFADFASTLPTIGYQPRLLGTSGTVTTLASVHLGLPSYDRSKIDGLVLPSEALRAVSTDLAHKSVPERAEVPCIGAERADLVVAGCAILEAIMDIWPAERIGIADRGIREGILRSHDGEGTSMKQVRKARGRSESSRRWLERQLNDPYVKRAQIDGYRARSAYKLIELDERFELLKGAKRIVDLGIAPGGWSQVARHKAPNSKIVGIDLLPTDPIDGVTIFEMDFLGRCRARHPDRSAGWGSRSRHVGYGRQYGWP